VTYTYEYPRPALTVDAVVFGLTRKSLQILLVERGGEPFKGCWALPGGFVGEGEDLQEAARRELEEETGVALSFLEQLYTFGAPGRDPRGRVVTVAYFALVRPEQVEVFAASDAAAAAWFPIDRLPPLAFDHDRIVGIATERLRGKVRYEPLGFDLLPESFTLGQLQELYETVLGRSIDKRNFRRKIKQMDVLHATGERQPGTPHRAPELFRFDPTRYQQLVRRGLEFEL
jgi:8-oxo-dGTP diphosphatase